VKNPIPGNHEKTTSCQRKLDRKIKKKEKKRHNSGKFAVLLKFFQYSLFNNSHIQTISAKTKHNDSPTRPEQTWPYFAV
jgi:hypothetical protein